MEVQPSPSSPRSFTIPKPENGLAEWTQKIKALQRQVDADDEEEHRRLEQEIAASRLARVRRSAGFSSRLGTVELPNVDDVNPVSEQAASPDDQFASNRQTDRADAMQKLVGSSHRPSEDVRPNASKPPSSQTKPEAMSLAAFMGGRATGPRLNRHAPQQDAHDPTQFEQRDLKSISAPHPVFGRGGVAMPGLAAKGRIPPASVEHSTPTRVPSSEHASDVGSVHSGYGSDRDGKRERRISTGAALRRYQEHVGQQAPPPQKTGSGGREAPRVRTFSTPTGAAPVRTTPPLQSAMKPSVSRPITPASSPPEAHASTPPIYTNGSAPFPAAPALAKPTPPSASFTSRQTTMSLTSRPSPITTPSLARPIQPAPKSPAFIPQAPAAQLPSLARPIQPAPKSPSLPQAPPSKVPSPAFLRTPLQKEPTPSISRLKGRGFVQSMVKASSQLEASASGSPSVSEMGRSVPAKRLTSVAERWAPTPSPSPPTAPKTLKSRKSFSSEPPASAASNGSSKPIEPVHTGKSLKKSPSIPALKAQHTGGTEASKAMSSTETSPPSGPGLGSSSTMISYIRPVKTGDDPATSAPPVRSRPTTPAPVVDELGVRESIVKETRFAPSELPSPSGKPLSHLTKGRAKKPKKAKGATVTFKDTVEVGPRASADTSIRREDIPPLKPASRPLPRVPPPSSTSAGETRAGPTSVQSTDAPSTLPIPSPAAVSARRETSKVGGIGDRWANQPIIGVKPVGKSPSPSASAQRGSETKEKGQLRGRALPGLAAVDKAEVKTVEQSPRSPRRMSRIPSTGNRATVMDVAQVMHAQVSSATSVSPSSSPKDERAEPFALREVPAVVNGSGPVAPGKPSDTRSPKAALPPLREEKIPIPSPGAGKRSRNASLSVSGASAASDAVDAEVQTQTPKDEVNDMIKINFADDHIPTVNVGKLLQSKTPPFTPDLGIKTVSVDVMSIVASTATAVAQGNTIFHESEVLAIIHRFKAKSSGLVATRVWGWHGKHSQLGEHEDRKLKDLARHYNTTLTPVPQSCEPAELVHILGGRLIIRQGSRSHWSSENTTMHLVRSENGIIFIDEHDFDIANLCSGFAFVLTLLGTVYVWHGRGSLPQERDAAVAYARTLAPQESDVTELEEGQNGDDEMFRMMLGDSGHACADYWRWRPTTEVDSISRLWRVDAMQKGDSTCIPVPHLRMESSPRSHVYIIDCTWEFFVLVGQDARSNRRAIRIALATAKEMSRVVSPSRPFTPNVHVIMLPSQLPSDLRLHRRDLDEGILNEQDVPDHMNIVSSQQGFEDLEKGSWERPALKHLDMLPLGLHPSMLS